MARSDALWRTPTAPIPPALRNGLPGPDPESEAEESRRAIAALSGRERALLEARARAERDRQERDVLDTASRAAAQADADRRHHAIERLAREQQVWADERNRLGDRASEAHARLSGCRATIGAASAAGDHEAAVEAAMRCDALERIAGICDTELQAHLCRQPAFSGLIR